MTVIQGVQSTSEVTPVLVDNQGRVLVTGSSASLFTPIPKAALYSNLNLPAAGGNFTVVTVPAGEYWRFTQGVIQYNGAHAPPAMGIAIDLSGGPFFVFYVPAATPFIPYSQTFDILLKPADQIVFNIGAVNLNDDGFLWYSAERVY